MRVKRITAIFVLILVCLIAYGEEKEDKSLLLKIGHKDLKDKILAVSPGKIYSAHEGKAIPFSKMINEMKNSRFVYVGESHNSLPMHDAQLKIIQSLYEQDRNQSIGVEMFPVTSQEALNKWSLGILSKKEFIREAEWYVNWSFNFGFYEKIFEFAKDNKIPVYALNVQRALISKIRMRGWEALSEEEKEMVPQPDISNEEHRTLIRTIFESTDIPHQMKGKGLDFVFEGLYRAQSAWDEVMAFNALRAARIEERKMVVLAGSGHLLYNLGINLRAFKKSRYPFKTVICVVVPEGKENVEISRSLADLIWGMQEEARPAFPSIGLKFKKFDRLENLVIERNPIDGVARGSDFKKGDVILSVDGKAYSETNELRIYLAEFTWDDEVKFRLLRNAQEIEVTLKFQISEKK